jgi:site-specific DNA-methyltransferase (adenine-specific)
VDVAVIQADALAFNLAGLGAHVMIVDPPYSAHVHENAVSVGTPESRAARLAVEHPHAYVASVRDRDLGFASLSPHLQERIAEMAASVARWSVVFSDLEGTYAWRERATFKGAEYVREVPWIRWSQPQLSGDRPCAGAEAVLHFHRQNVGPKGGRSPIAKHWNGPGSLTHYARRCLRGADKHPTEKPLDLMLDIVSWFSDPGELVLDPCAGAGTTGLACRLLGRDFVGLDLDATWAARAAARATAPLVERDRKRAIEWIESTIAEASAVPSPTGNHDVRTWERAQRRIADAERVMGAL